MAVRSIVSFRFQSKKECKIQRNCHSVLVSLMNILVLQGTSNRFNLLDTDEKELQNASFVASNLHSRMPVTSEGDPELPDIFDVMEIERRNAQEVEEGQEEVDEQMEKEPASEGSKLTT
uniref:Uncharacterized protein n=1 Tax=Onchocerca volvulus TaxID=6282 RepID=A0A8R1TW28_ONCVO